MMQRAVRSAVLHTAHYRIFDTVYQQYYRYVLRSLGQWFADPIEHPVALLLRVDAVDHRFEPGLSDIDFTIVHRPHGNREQIRFLERFWSRYRRIKRLHPILGEVGIFDTDEIREFARVGGGPTGVGKRWYLTATTLSPEETLDVESCCDQLTANSKPPRTALLQDVLTRYAFYFLPRYFRSLDRPHGAEPFELRHVGAHILRRLGRPGDAPEPQSVFSALADACRFDALSATEPPIEIVGVSPKRANDISPATGNAAQQLRALGAEIALGISEPLSGCNTALIILPDDSPRERLDTAAHLSRQLLRTMPAVSDSPVSLAAMYPSYSWPLLVPQSAVTSWMKIFPFEAASLTASSTNSALARYWAHVRRDHVIQACRTWYGGMLTMKNNWRTSHTPGQRMLLASQGWPRILRAEHAARSLGTIIDFSAPQHSSAKTLEHGLDRTRRALGELASALERGLAPKSDSRHFYRPASLESEPFAGFRERLPAERK